MTGLEIAALVSAIGGGIGQIGSLLGGDQGMTSSDIDRLITRMRRRGTATIGSEVARGKVKAAQSAASAGFGDTTMSLDALAGVEGFGIDALLDLEGELGETEAGLLTSLAGLQQRESMFRRSELSELFGGVSDLGISYLISRYFPKTTLNVESPLQQYSPSDLDMIIKSSYPVSSQLIG